jgi:phosphoribosyl-AMP cyclohydrolase
MQLDPEIAKRLKRNEAGLVCAVVQDASTGRVLMVAWTSDDALAETLATGRGVYWSRSRNELWRKGDTSGHVQHVRSAEIDCDGDAILLTVDQEGPACHTGKESCFDEGGALPVVVGGVS